MLGKQLLQKYLSTDLNLCNTKVDHLKCKQWEWQWQK